MFHTGKMGKCSFAFAGILTLYQNAICRNLILICQKQYTIHWTFHKFSIFNSQSQYWLPIHPGSLTARPWKGTLPNGKFSSKQHFFRGKLLNFGGCIPNFEIWRNLSGQGREPPPFQGFCFVDGNQKSGLNVTSWGWWREYPSISKGFVHPRWFSRRMTWQSFHWARERLRIWKVCRTS